MWHHFYRVNEVRNSSDVSGKPGGWWMIKHWATDICDKFIIFFSYLNGTLKHFFKPFCTKITIDYPFRLVNISPVSMRAWCCADWTAPTHQVCSCTVQHLHHLRVWKMAAFAWVVENGKPRRKKKPLNTSWWKKPKMDAVVSVKGGFFLFLLGKFLGSIVSF